MKLCIFFLQDKFVQYRCKDLMNKFERILMSNAAKGELNDDFLFGVGTNAFRAYLHEFKNNKKKYSKPETKEKKKPNKGNRQKEEKKDQPVIVIMHSFVLIVDALFSINF